MLASTTIASKMLYDSVKEIISHPQKIAYLVSRDTKQLSPSDINKAAIETYAENLSDGVIAPLFYLLLFGLPGAFVYKAINTLDSMVGYRNERYEKFGKFAARLDDVANYIPARMTAMLIILLTPKVADMESAPTSSPKGSTHRLTPTNNKSVAKQRIHSLLTPHSSLLTKVFRNGKRHESPNAGYPISAMAYALGIKLGGPTSYFGKLKPKAWFGEGRETITTEDIANALKLQPRLDIVILLFLSLGVLL
jgi:adenosylcobinamide-phosphate synthase